MSTATQPQVTRGFKVRCPLCGTTEAGAVRLRADDLTDFTCAECGDDFSVADVEAYLAEAERWRQLLAWIRTAPEVGD